MTDQQRIAEIKALCDAAQTRIAKVSGADLTAPGISISIYNDIAPTCERNLRKLAGNANQYIPFLLTQLAASQRREKAAVEFINWFHSEFGRYMPAVYYDKFDKWRGPQEAGKGIEQNG